MESILLALSGTTTAEVEITNSVAVIYSVAAGLLGLLISLTYMKTGNRVSKNFARTLITLPILVCIVLLVVNGNFGTSIAVLGAFSLVRFRSLQGSSRDISFIFFSMTIGIVCAVGEVILATILTTAICVIYFILNAIKYGANNTEEKDLRITIPENLDYSDIFDDLFERYTKENRQIAVRTTNMGSMYEINYRVKLKNEREEKQFLDDIRMRNGNLTVICGRCDMNEAEEL
ncbi:MAG: DUF4956 domain-containing protein [Pseudobutyrivibrio sp.]|nr:DUF4956 domain-containing protein [Pseudobutyrivibrio sp.]